MEKYIYQGIRIKYLVEKSGMTILEFGKKAGIQEKQMHSLFKQQYVHTKWLIKIMGVLKCDIISFFSRDLTAEMMKENGKDPLAEIVLLKQRLSDKEDVIQSLKDQIAVMNGDVPERRRTKAS